MCTCLFTTRAMSMRLIELHSLSLPRPCIGKNTQLHQRLQFILRECVCLIQHFFSHYPGHTEEKRRKEQSVEPQQYDRKVKI